MYKIILVKAPDDSIMLSKMLFFKEPFWRLGILATPSCQNAKGRGQNGVAFWRLIVEKCLLLLVGESRKFTGKMSRRSH